eukprot:464778_1
MAPQTNRSRMNISQNPDQVPSDDDIMSLPEDMPAPPPPNLRELNMSANNDEWQKRKSKQFGFRRPSEKNNKDSISIPKIKPNIKRGSLAIRVRSDSGKEKQLVNYIDPKDKDLEYESQDNVNPLAFALRKKQEKKRLKKKKQNTLSTNWNTKEEKKMKKKLRKKRMAQQKKQQAISIGLGGIKEDSAELAEDAFNNNNLPGPPAVPPPPNAKDIPGPPQVNVSGDSGNISVNLPGPPTQVQPPPVLKGPDDTGKKKKKMQIKFSGMDDDKDKDIQDSFLEIERDFIGTAREPKPPKNYDDMNQNQNQKSDVMGGYVIEENKEDDNDIGDAFLEINRDMVKTAREPKVPKDYNEADDSGNMNIGINMSTGVYSSNETQKQQQPMQPEDDGAIGDAFLVINRDAVKTAREPKPPKDYNEIEDAGANSFGITIPTSVYSPNKPQQQQQQQQQQPEDDNAIGDAFLGINRDAVKTAREPKPPKDYNEIEDAGANSFGITIPTSVYSPNKPQQQQQPQQQQPQQQQPEDDNINKDAVKTAR